MDQLNRAAPLANRYLVMRHGQSKANVRGIIVSSIDRDRAGDFGLSEAGREQVLATACGCGLPASTLICSSDFARAGETAQIVRACLGVPEGVLEPRVVLAPALRERYFGECDGCPVACYARVWAADEAGGRAGGGAGGGAGAGDPVAGHPVTGHPVTGHPVTGHPVAGVERAAAVLERAAALVADLERSHRDRDILLVSHGDTLQILQAGFSGLDPSRHRSVRHLETAEIRRLELTAR
jgi:probable phosphoglycerate mutase